MFNIKSYHKAASIKEALALLSDNPEARLVAGGTDVLIKLHKGKSGFEHLIDVHDITELDFINRTAGGDIEIGSGTCFTRVCESDLICKHIPVLSAAVQTIGGPQVRNMATIGGNLCNGVPSADSAPPLICLNTELTIESAAGERKKPLEDFFKGPGQVNLKSQELLTTITVTHDNYAGYHGHYYKYAMREAMDIATIGCAAVCRVDDGLLTDLRIAFGTAAPVPIRCRKTEGRFRGERLSSRLLDGIAASVPDDVKPRTSWRATREFRLQIISTLAARVVKQAVLNAGGTIR